MNQDETYMRQAIQEAKKSLNAGGVPIGAVMVKDGSVIATGWSLVWPKKDPTAHGETECIKAACQKLNTLNLEGCTLYSTLESCSMCLGCAGWANVSRIVFGAFKEDIPPNPYEIADYHAISHARSIQLSSGKKLEIMGGVLKDECAALMMNIENWSPK